MKELVKTNAIGYKAKAYTLLQQWTGFLVLISIGHATMAQEAYILFEKQAGHFCLSANNVSKTIYIDSLDYPGVLRAAGDLQTDIGKVTTVVPALTNHQTPTGNEIVIIGTIGKNVLIDKLIRTQKIDVHKILGKWEAFHLEVIDKPFPGVARAFVIAGSDKRGTIYGIYDVCKQIGVSPWYWWADVPPRQNKSLYIKPGIIEREPAVKYRGIFLNDEEPALGRWAVEKYGGFNHQCYEKMFELILRLKGNYLWPAMWWASFNSDDTLNPTLADDYGIVMGTTHHEPMMRAHAEWKTYKGGAWNYATNEARLKEFWQTGIKRMNGYESIVTLGMRGDGDMAMSAETNTTLLERIVNDQRAIIKDITHKEPEATPQLWALYKEVQDYYDHGMRVPDDVTLLLCDDNWGNIRKLPKTGEPKRKGGYGIYYHFDYVGGPRNYKWVNTNPLPRIWEQMHLAYEYDATTLWLVNVGDLKPLEFPISFFLDYAWNPNQWNQNTLEQYTLQWCTEQFGSNYAPEIASLITLYAKYNARRKPELLNSKTYSLTYYRETEKIVRDFTRLEHQAEHIYQMMPAHYKDAFYELVLYPVTASANLNKMYYAQARNNLYAQQGRVSTNNLADSVAYFYKQDSIKAQYYNNTLANGKWNHMMDQTHISYTYWQQPEKDVMPVVERIQNSASADMAIAVEGSPGWWPDESQQAVLPAFDRYTNQTYYIDVFNRGSTPFSVDVKATTNWITTSLQKGIIDQTQRIYVTINWSNVPPGEHNGSILLSGTGKEIAVTIVAQNQGDKIPPGSFVESNRYIAMEAVHYSKARHTKGITWTSLHDLGRTLSGMTTFPVTAPRQSIETKSPCLEYTIYTYSTGEISVSAYFSPTIDFGNNGGLKYGISMDNEPVQTINLHADNSTQAWEESVRNNIIIKSSTHAVKQPGNHVIKFWRIDPGVIVQKLVLDMGGVKPSYLGPPESYRTPSLK